MTGQRLNPARPAATLEADGTAPSVSLNPWAPGLLQDPGWLTPEARGHVVQRPLDLVRTTLARDWSSSVSWIKLAPLLY